MSKDNYAFKKLVNIVAQLRDPKDGCPWDLEQTHYSLGKYLQEETNETIEVLETFRDGEHGDYKSLKDELGDVLLQVLLHSQLASEKGEFEIEDVIDNLNEKLLRRHPHVFGDSKASTIEDVRLQWEKIKEQERKDREN